MNFSENIKNFILQNPGYEITVKYKYFLSIVLLVSSVFSFSYFNEQIIKDTQNETELIDMMLTIGMPPLVIVILLILLLLYHDTIRFNKKNTITTTDVLMASSIMLSFFYAWFCFSLFHWVPIFYLVLFLIQLSLMTRGKYYDLYWLIWILCFVFTVLEYLITQNSGYIGLTTLFSVVALFKLIEDWIASLFRSSPSPHGNTDRQTREIFGPTIHFSLFANLATYVFYCLILYSIKDPKMIENMDISKLAINFYLFALPLHVTIFTVIAGVITIVHTLRTDNKKSNLPTKIAKGLKAFIMMYIIILGFLVIGFLTAHIIDFSGDSSWGQTLLLLIANFAFEFSILVIMPTLVYVYALITGLMKAR